MTGLQIVLLFIGVVFMVGSFLVTERLSSNEINRISELSENEIDKIVGRSLDKASTQVENSIDQQIENSIEKVDRAIEKETNEKIMAISEYSDTVVESMNKTHNEIMFLYSMLNDKHTEVTNFSAKLEKLIEEAQKVETRQETYNSRMETEMRYAEPASQNIPDMPVQSLEIPGADGATDSLQQETKSPQDSIMDEFGNHNKDVLRLHKEGYSDVAIAQELNIGLGEVRLIIGLFKGDR